MIKIAALVLFVFFLPPCLLMATEEKISDALQTPFVSYNKSQNTLSVKLMDSDITDVAKLLSQRAGIKILLDRSIGQTISSEFQNLPLELGIRRLLRPVSSAFVFIKEKGPSDEDRFRLNTVKIFQSGNMLGAEFEEFDQAASAEAEMPPVARASVLKTDSERRNDKSGNKRLGSQHQKPGYRRQRPGAYGEKRREIMLTRQNLDTIRSKKKAETDAANHKIMELKAQLFKNASPDQRPALMRALYQAEQELVKIKTVNSQLIMDEERNLRELSQESTSLEHRKKFAEAQAELESHLNGQGREQRLGENYRD